MRHFIPLLPILMALSLMLVEAGRARGKVSSGCLTKPCPNGKICVSNYSGSSCVVPNGGPCTVKDKCEGGYYCLWGNTCSGDKSGQEGEDCSNSSCRGGLYCDQKDMKCHRIDKVDGCYSDADCSSICTYFNSCYCYNLKCLPKP